MWASGSQVWNGQIGTFTANATTKAQNATDFTVRIGTLIGSPKTVNGWSSADHLRVISTISKVSPTTPINEIANNNPREPAIVRIRNLMEA